MKEATQPPFSMTELSGWRLAYNRMPKFELYKYAKMVQPLVEVAKYVQHLKEAFVTGTLNWQG